MNDFTLASRQSALTALQVELSLLDLKLGQHIYQMGDQCETPQVVGVDEPYVSKLCSDDAAPAPDMDSRSTSEESMWVNSEIQRLEGELFSRKQGNGAGVQPTRLDSMCQLLGLDEFERSVVVLCLLPQIDSKYTDILAYIHEDLNKRQPTVELALQVLCDGPDQMVEGRRSFAEDAPLVKYRLIELAEENGQGPRSLLGRFVGLDPLVVDYLFGITRVDHRISSFSKVTDDHLDWGSIVLPSKTKARLLELPEQLAKLQEWNKSPTLHLIGPSGCGKTTAAKVIAHSLGGKLLAVDCAGLLTSEVTPGWLIWLVCRQALLQRALVLFQNSHLLLGEEPKQLGARTAINRLVEESNGITLFSGELAGHLSLERADMATFTVELPPPGLKEREELWKSCLVGLQTNITDQELGYLAGKYRCNGREVKNAVASARNKARVRSSDSPVIEANDLHSCFRDGLNRNLGQWSQKVEPRSSWPDLVLPEESKRQLREICDCFQNRSLVYGDWGFETSHSSDKGLTALFVGPSGTGKTMAAEVVARELDMDLFRVDLSTTLSKYIGETERNLGRVFQAAAQSNAILLFDEADALFAKRTEVRDSHDRYANIEVSYLLQKVEEYQGMAILTSNLRNNVDDAFLRRLSFAVEFPFPDEELRLRIWQRVFPPAAPLDSDVDLSFAARQFRISGGNIKNISLTAAFLAAGEGGSIGMKHLIQATRREYVKLGKLQSEREFGPYVHQVVG